MSAKNNHKLMALLFLFFISLASSCTYYTLEEKDASYADNISSEGHGVIIVLNQTKNTSEAGAAIVLNESKIINLSEEQPEKESEPTSVRASEVEFYFLLKGKAYFKHTIKEEESKSYNITGYLVTITPIIITSDSVKFRINNYTTKALGEDESDSTPEFEIIVSNIYYRR